MKSEKEVEKIEKALKCLEESFSFANYDVEFSYNSLAEVVTVRGSDTEKEIYVCMDSVSQVIRDVVKNIGEEFAK